MDAKKTQQVETPVQTLKEEEILRMVRQAGITTVTPFSYSYICTPDDLIDFARFIEAATTANLLAKSS